MGLVISSAGAGAVTGIVGVVVIGGGMLGVMTFIVLARVIEGVVSGSGMIEAEAMIGLL